jgi:O-antigen/teichoic acid export membrane protein
MSIIQLAKQSIIYGLGHIISRFITFLLLPILTVSLTTNEFGIISKFYAFTGFAMAFYRYGMDTALMKFYIQTHYSKAYFSSILVLQIISSILFSGLILIAGQPLSQLIFGFYEQKYILYIITIICADIIWNLSALILRVEKKPILFISLNLINVISILALTIYLVNEEMMGIEGVLLANVIASIITLIISSYLLFNRFSIKTVDFNFIKPILKFGLPFFPAAIFAMILESADRFILSYLLNDHFVGIYSAGYKLGIFGLLIVMAFNMGWTPYFLEHGKEKNANNNFACIQTLFLGIMGFLGILLTTTIPWISSINIMGYRLIGVNFIEGIIILPVILISYYFFGLYVLLLPTIYILEKTYIIPIIRGLGAMSNVLLNFILIPLLGIMGAALANLGAFIIMFLAIFIATNNLQPTKYNFKGWIFPLLMWLIVICFNNHIGSLAIIILYPILWYRGVLNVFEKEKLKEFFV